MPYNKEKDRYEYDPDEPYDNDFSSTFIYLMIGGLGILGLMAVIYGFN